MPADDLGDDEREELLCELRIEMGLLGEFSESGDLPGFPRLVGRGQTVVGFEFTDALGELEALGEEVNEGGIDVVDAASQLLQPFDCMCPVVSVLIHAPSLSMPGHACAPHPFGRGAQAT